MHSPSKRIVILGTGGTIAGRASNSGDNVGYRAGELSVDDLVAAVPPLRNLPLEAEQVAQVDSKDMSHAIWQQLALRIAHHQRREDVAGIVVTHGTDTLEETAYFLHCVLQPGKPVVLTAAMRPATSLQADGPQNLLDAVAVAATEGVVGVVAVMGGRVFAGDGLRKVDGYRIEAFDAGEGGPLGVVEEGRLRVLRPWLAPLGRGGAWATASAESWPRVAWVTNHAGIDAALVPLLVNAGFDGIVVAGTGNGTLHAALEKELQRARSAGVAVRLTSRCAQGRVVGRSTFDLSSAAGPAQARVDLLLDLLQQRN